jgi:hypothetical protein
MTRLDAWIATELAYYERYYGPLSEDEKEKYAERLRGTLNGVQLRVADSAGVLGDTVLAALKAHSDGLRDSALARWFRDPR